MEQMISSKRINGGGVGVDVGVGGKIKDNGSQLNWEVGKPTKSIHESCVAVSFLSHRATTRYAFKGMNFSAVGWGTRLLCLGALIFCAIYEVLFSGVKQVVPGRKRGLALVAAAVLVFTVRLFFILYWGPNTVQLRELWHTS